jgi:hypothetical protein
MSVLKELVENYESGEEMESGHYRTKKRVLLVDPDSGTYDGWRTDTAVPAYGEEYPGDSSLTVVTREAQGYGGTDPSIEAALKYRLAKVTLTYSTNTLNNYTFASGDMTAELMSITGAFTVSGQSVDVVVPVAIEPLVIPRRSISRPHATIHGMLGCINSIAWQPFDYLYPIGTVFFAGCPWRMVWDPEANAVLYEMDYTFSINPLGWNNRYDPSTGAMAAWEPGFTAVSFAGFPPA